MLFGDNFLSVPFRSKRIQQISCCSLPKHRLFLSVLYACSLDILSQRRNGPNNCTHLDDFLVLWSCSLVLHPSSARLLRYSCVMFALGVGGGRRPQLLVERRLARVVASQASGLRRRSRGLARVAHSSDVGGADRTRPPHTVSRQVSHGES